MALKTNGYLYIADPDGPPTERDTMTCGHCQQMVQVKPNTGGTVYLIPVMHVGHAEGHWHYKEEDGAFCRVCMRPICLECHERGRCRTWERWFERLEAKGAWWRRFLSLGG